MHQKITRTDPVGSLSVRFEREILNRELQNVAAVGIEHVCATSVLKISILSTNQHKVHTRCATNHLKQYKHTENSQRNTKSRHHDDQQETIRFVENVIWRVTGGEKGSQLNNYNPGFAVGDKR
jgi:hypothetical protein